MPSAQQNETVDQEQIAIDGVGTDFHSLVQAIHASNISNLSLLHPRGKVLFAEGEPARGIFILRTGRATASISSSEGRMVILQIAQGGDVLGLNSVIRNACYNTTIKTIEPCRTEFIPRPALLDLIERNQAAARAVSQILSREIADLMERARLLLLPQTTIAKLARLLLDWCEQPPTKASSTLTITRCFTHEEIAQMICSSRETVTRLLTSLNGRGIIRVTSDHIQICEDAALQKIAVG
jgi:CRP/FNR family transcriptional regulator